LRIAAIIPAYNEETRIAPVLQAVLETPQITEVWVVSDGSTDGTYEVAEATPGVRAVRLPQNRGKGAAMLAGAQLAEAPTLLFLDADLVGLTPGHVEALVSPVMSMKADMTVGVFRGGRFWTDLAQKLAPHISGQRCIRRSAFLDARHVADLRYGVEVALYRHALEEGLRIEVVTLSNLTHPMKEEKIGFLRGFASRLRMYAEIGKGLAVPTLRARRNLSRELKNRLGI